eukprot:SAG31_NODE_1224_length_9286_cov_11.643953_3_plen_214_part_00
MYKVHVELREGRQLPDDMSERVYISGEKVQPKQFVVALEEAWDRDGQKWILFDAKVPLGMPPTGKTKVNAANKLELARQIAEFKMSGTKTQISSAALALPSTVANKGGLVWVREKAPEVGTTPEMIAQLTVADVYTEVTQSSLTRRLKFKRDRRMAKDLRAANKELEEWWKDDGSEIFFAVKDRMVRKKSIFRKLSLLSTVLNRTSAYTLLPS